MADSSTPPTSRQQDTLNIAVIGGDGIGPEVVAEGLKVLAAVTGESGPKVHTTEYDLGARRWHATGETLPDSVLEELRGQDAILLGAIGDPGVPSGVLERGVLLPLRFALDHYVNLRPARLYPGVTSPLDVARAAPTASTSSSSARAPRAPTSATAGPCGSAPPHEVATEVSVNTALRRRAGRPRRLRHARQAARASSSRSCTSTTCSPTPATSGAAPSRRSARSSPTSSTDYLHVDAATIFLATDPPGST